MKKKIKEKEKEKEAGSAFRAENILFLYLNIKTGWKDQLLSRNKRKPRFEKLFFCYLLLRLDFSILVFSFLVRSWSFTHPVFWFLIKGRNQRPWGLHWVVLGQGPQWTRERKERGKGPKGCQVVFLFLFSSFFLFIERPPHRRPTWSMAQRPWEKTQPAGPLFDRREEHVWAAAGLLHTPTVS
jgi:hypothetical protein